MELKEIRKKIVSINNIWKLTSALETLSALKMKKAQKFALLSRPFSQKVSEILSLLEFQLTEGKSIFLIERKIKKILIGVVTSDRGFCGPFNQNILKFVEKEVEKIKKEGELEFLAIGKKGFEFFKKKNWRVREKFFGIGDYGELEETKEISDFLINVFLKDEFQKIYFFFSDFISSFLQKPTKIQILPLTPETISYFLKAEIEKERKIEFFLEPSREKIIDEILPQLVEYLVYQAILESNASEHSARMMAMKNAAENAQKKFKEWILVYNKLRQEQITKEVSEISTTKEVVAKG